MGLFIKRKRTEAQQRFAHAMAGVLLLVHAFEKFEQHHVKAGTAFVLFGMAFVLYAWFHPRLHGHPIAPHLETGVFLIEGTAITITAAVYFHAGKKGLPACYMIAAVMYFVQAILQHRRNLRAAAVPVAH